VEQPERIQLEDTASPEDVAKVERVFRDAGVEAPVEATWHKGPRGNGFFWMILTLVLSTGAIEYVRAFARTLGELHAVAADQALRQFLSQLREARGPFPERSGGYIQFKDEAGTTLALTGEEPPEALAALLALEPDQVRGGMVMWNDKTGEWLDINRIERNRIERSRLPSGWFRRLVRRLFRR
jgi:hypothetical protein